MCHYGIFNMLINVKKSVLIYDNTSIFVFRKINNDLQNKTTVYKIISEKTVVIIALTHMAFTFLPLFFFPDISFSEAPLSLSMIGQYIIKNLIIVCALIYIYPRKGLT